MSEVNILDELSQATSKPIKQVEVEQPSTDFDEDFDDDETPEEETLDEEGAAAPGDDGEEEPEEPINVQDRHRKQANRWLRLYDSISRPLLKGAYSLKLLKPGDKEIAKEFRNKYQHRSDEEIQSMLMSNDDLAERMKRYSIYLNVCEKIALDEEEKKEGQEILAELIAKHKKLQMSPETQLGFWLLGITAVRAEPLLENVDLFGWMRKDEPSQKPTTPAEPKGKVVSLG